MRVRLTQKAVGQNQKSRIQAAVQGMMHMMMMQIRPIYDEEPMAKVQTTAEINVFAIGQHHTEQPEFSNEGEVVQNAEECHDTWKLTSQPHRNQSVVRQPNAFKSERTRISKPQCDSQVNVNYDLTKPVITHYFPKEREAAFAKPHHMIASSNSRISSKNMPRFSSNDMKCVVSANHDSCVTKFLNEFNSRAKVPSNKTPKRNKIIEQISVPNEQERQIPTGHKFSIQKTSVVQKKTTTPRSCLRWKPTGKIFKTVGLRWVPTGKIFSSSITKVDSEPLNGSNADITNQYECKQTLDVSAEHLSDTYVFIVKMEIMLEPTSNKLLVDVPVMRTREHGKSNTSVKDTCPNNALNLKGNRMILDPGIVEGQATQTVISHNAAYQAGDLNAYDSDCDEHNIAKVSLMENLSHYGLDVLAEKAQQLKPNLYDGNVIKNTYALTIPDSEKTLKHAEESHSKMLLKQQDPMVLEKKVNTTPVDYNSMNSLDPSPSCRPTKVEVLNELPKVSMDKVNKDIEEIEMINIELDHKVSRLIAENEHLKQIYKQLYDSIKPKRIRSKEQCGALINQVNQKFVEISDLNVSLQEKDLVITTHKNKLRKLKGKYLADNIVTKHTIASEMLKFDMEPIARKLLNNITAHSDYLRHTQEQATILREVVEQGKSQNPINNSLDSAWPTSWSTRAGPHTLG
uniref:Integrase, catalytic region, zinc finger, CCHC-type, peptidase aspartic, catalytic n=1 Tax=Tanacetum cinerariifolium TaxID=118510 RepID=A0A6L2NP57_TANCI|nr:hypothetical protein [Tanacetum cinerariifolium]